jgi:hypothetical protein
VTEPSNDISIDQEFRSRHEVPSKPKPFQFRLRSLFIATVVVAVLLGIGRIFGETELFGAVFGFSVLIATFVLPIATVILLSIRSDLDFRGWERILLFLSPGIHSVCMMMLATVAFEPKWKGEKGFHWLYYVLDAPAGYTLWPIYWIGVISFVAGLLHPRRVRQSRFHFTMILTLIGISMWYTGAALFMKFCPPLLAYIPAIVSVEYGLYLRLVAKHAEFGKIHPFAYFALLSAWATSVLGSFYLKIPLAMQFYEQLPNQPPPSCFIVTAASRGHWWLVRTWRDDSGCIVNRQLLTFWQFEAILSAKVPQLHRVLRSIYNGFAPTVARLIVFPWMADIVYLLLKPVEWMVILLNRLWKCWRCVR